jgi:uncharacterized protein YidB (DUF937 family)
MFEVLIREAAARFGLGDKALPLIQMLLACMTRKETGGLAGFLETFKAAGLGPIIQSWLGGGPAAQPIGNSQLETVLGASDGLLSALTERLGLPRDNVTSALGYLLPPLVGKLTPGGNTPSSLPVDIVGLATIGQDLLSAPVGKSANVNANGTLIRWLPWVIVAAAVLIGLGYCARDRVEGSGPATSSVPASVAEPASGVPVPVVGSGPAAPAASSETGKK